MTYEESVFKNTIDTLPEDIDWKKTMIYAKVPEAYLNLKPRTFWQKFFFGEYNTPWDSLHKTKINGELWACIHDPWRELSKYTKIDEHTRAGKIVKHEVSVLVDIDFDVNLYAVTADWQDCLYRVLDDIHVPTVVTSKKVKDL